MALKNEERDEQDEVDESRSEGCYAMTAKEEVIDSSESQSGVAGICKRQVQTGAVSVLFSPGVEIVEAAKKGTLGSSGSRP